MRLQRLYLGYTQITDGCVESLAKPTRLQTLMLRATRVSPALAAELARSARARPALGGVDTGRGGAQESLIR
jgi:hypothetical protein